MILLTSDIYTADTIFKILYNNNFEKLYQQSHLILEETENPAVKMIAVTGITSSLIKKGRYKEAEVKIIESITSHSQDVIRSHGYSSSANFNYYPIAYAIDLMVKSDSDYEMMVKFLKRLEVKISDEKLLNLIKYQMLRLQDIYMGDKQTVLNGYKEWLANTPDYYHYDFIEQQDIDKVVKKRIKEIEMSMSD